MQYTLTPIRIAKTLPPLCQSIALIVFEKVITCSTVILCSVVEIIEIEKFSDFAVLRIDNISPVTGSQQRLGRIS